MEGSGSNGIEKSETEPPKKEEVVVVVESEGDSVSRTVSIEVVGEIAKEESCNGDSFVDNDDDEKLLGSSTLHEEPKMIEKAESLKEEELEKSTELLKEEKLKKSVVEEVDTVEEKIVPSISEVVTDDPVEKVVLVSEELPKVVEDIPIVEKTNNLEANELLQKDSDDKIVETPVVVSVLIVEEAKNLEANELLQKESVETPVMKSVVIKKTEASCEPASNESVDKDVAASLDAPNVETEVAEESGITERSQDEPQENVLIVPPMVQKATWKSCCGLFEAVSSSDR
ncbi:hypothetical protein AQUCO_02200060v1 [Aquilegia coerulea]|nr:hypothetical protein AQUCO_02200060v1 [Aquilegia coerulea]